MVTSVMMVSINQFIKALILNLEQIQKVHESSPEELVELTYDGPSACKGKILFFDLRIACTDFPAFVTICSKYLTYRVNVS